MALTVAQLATLKAHVLADPALVPFTSGPTTDYAAIAAALNAPSSPAFIVRRSSVQTDEVGRTVSYVAVASMTSANTGRIQLFYDMNPNSFFPSADVEQFFTDTFGGALGGQGQATRDALVALWRRTATRAERVLATGTGTTNDPGRLVFEGAVSISEVNQMFQS